jgi:hypothetical protein
MASKPKCKSCSRVISGKISIDTYRRKLGKKLIKQVDYYCQKCYERLSVERAWDVYRKEKAICKKKNNRRTRR